MWYVNFKKTRCKSCYACARVCPVNAIKFKNEQAQILKDRCIVCNECSKACPQKNSILKSEVSKIKFFFKNKNKVAVSIAPSFVSIFGENSHKIPTALKKLGFTYVEETVIATNPVLEQYNHYADLDDGENYFTSFCPTINNLIEKHFPQFTKNLIPVVSPFLCHTRLMKSKYHTDTKVVFIGPCLAKKDEGSTDVSVDAVITFAELQKWFKKENINLDELEEAKAGDIVVVTKVGDLKTGDTIAAKPDAVPLDPIELPKPQIYYAIVPKNKGDEEKIASCLNKVSEEDPTIHWYRNPETKQTLVGGQGELHINTIKKQMKEKYGVDFDLEDIKVAYRETIKGSSDVQGKHKKQSGGRGQYGDVKIRFSRSTEDFDFSEEIFGGSVPKSYIPAVEKGLRDSMQKGILAGYPVTNIKAVLYDGSYHDVDSSEMAFKTAASIAFKKGMQEAKPILLEPIMKLKITVPEEYMGDVMGDINKRRGKILGMEPDDKGKQVIFAEAPQSETFKYAIDLRAMTQGRGQFEMEIEKYEEVPGQIAKKIIEEARNN